jgi:hypothetical protein
VRPSQAYRPILASGRAAAIKRYVNDPDLLVVDEIFGSPDCGVRVEEDRDDCDRDRVGALFGTPERLCGHHDLQGRHERML